jgi:DNA-binding transcriptional LysR family regulator
MDIRQLEIFVAVAKHNSFTRASRELHIVQPAISIAIRKLEEEVGVTLLNRSTKKVALTSEGKRLHQHALSILNQREQALLEMKELKGLEQGDVRIAMPAMHGSYFFPKLFSRFKQRYPALTVHVQEAGTKEVQQALLDGSTELGVVMVDEAPDTLEIKPFLVEQMVVLVSPSHRFAKQKRISFKQFIKEPLIVTREGYFMRETINRMSHQAGIEPKVQFETNLTLLTKQLVLDGHGISTGMSMVLKDETDVVGVPFNPPIRFNMGIAWKKNHYLSQSNQAFVNFLLETI